MRCKIKDCISPHKASGFCGKHYMQNKRATDPLYKQKEVENTRAWKNKNKEAHSAQQARYRVKHTKELTDYYNEWLKANWKDQMAYRYTRKRRVKQATPPWADLKAIHEFYLKCPKGYHVDHIIPLNGKNISGLHVIDNLQYLPAIENLKKGNRVA